jgi:hypothetical protein
MSRDPRTWREIRDATPDYVDPDRLPGYPEPVPAPARWRRASGLPAAPGTPHKVACTFFLRHADDEDARLVHGTIAPGGEPRPDAWVELSHGLVWDGLTRRFYSSEAWKGALAAERTATYDRPAAARLLLTTGHGGPWSATDRAAAGVDPA